MKRTNEKRDVTKLNPFGIKVGHTYRKNCMRVTGFGWDFHCTKKKKKKKK